MNDSTDAPQGIAHPAGSADLARPASAFADSWVRSESLVALEALSSAAVRVRPAIARRSGLTSSELTALERLMRGPVGFAELARLLEVSTAAATGVGDRLEGHGHAVRRAHASDRRRVELHVTESGREEVLAHLLPMFRELAVLDAQFTAEERAVVARYLDGARRAYERAAGAGPPVGVDGTPPPSDTVGT